MREVVPFYIFYGIPCGDDGKLFRLKVWCYIYRRHVGTYYDYKRTASYRKITSYRRTASQIDETAEKLGNIKQ